MKLFSSTATRVALGLLFTVLSFRHAGAQGLSPQEPVGVVEIDEEPDPFPAVDQGLVPDTTEARVLRQLYAVTGGADWTQQANWNEGTTAAELAEWYGVYVVAHDVYAFSLGGNNLQGPLPVELGQLTQLRNLDLSGNQLSGAFPDSWATLTKLQQLHLGYNQLSGTLPAWLGHYTNLYSFAANHNQFSGSLPAALSQCPNLHTLVLRACLGIG